MNFCIIWCSKLCCVTQCFICYMNRLLMRGLPVVPSLSALQIVTFWHFSCERQRAWMEVYGKSTAIIDSCLLQFSNSVIKSYEFAQDMKPKKPCVIHIFLSEKSVFWQGKWMIRALESNKLTDHFVMMLHTYLTCLQSQKKPESYFYLWGCFQKLCRLFW